MELFSFSTLAAAVSTSPLFVELIGLPSRSRLIPMTSFMSSSSQSFPFVFAVLFQMSFHDPVIGPSSFLFQKMPVVQIAYGTEYFAPASYQGFWNGLATYFRLGIFDSSSGSRYFA